MFLCLFIHTLEALLHVVSSDCYWLKWEHNPIEILLRTLVGWGVLSMALFVIRAAAKLLGWHFCDWCGLGLPSVRRIIISWCGGFKLPYAICLWLCAHRPIWHIEPIGWFDLTGRSGKQSIRITTLSHLFRWLMCFIITQLATRLGKIKIWEKKIL